MAFFGLDSNGNLKVVTGAAGAASIKISASSTSSMVSALTFSNANGVTFGFDGSNITASVTVPQASIRASIGTVTSLISAITFSNSNGVSFGWDGSILTASVVSNTFTGVKFSAGTASSVVTAITFSNSNGVSFGFDGTNMTASVATGTAAGNQTVSFFENVPHYMNNSTASSSFGISTIQFAMFNPQVAVSGKFARLIFSVNHAQNNLAATSTASYTGAFTRTYNFPWVIYSRGGGASSDSYVSVCSGLGQSIHLFSLSESGSSYSWSVTISFQSGSSTANYSTSFSSQSASVSFASSVMSGIAAANVSRWMDLPFNTSVPAGHYLFGIGFSTATASAANNTQFSNVATGFVAGNVSANFSIVFNNGVPAMASLGASATTSTYLPQLQGSITSNPAVSMRSSINTNELRAHVNQGGPFYVCVAENIW